MAAQPPGRLCIAPQGEFRVVERKITMKELLRALDEGRVREVFGSGTACQVCPVHRIVYQGKVRWGCRWGREGRRRRAARASRRFLLQHLHIPTMENGPELIHRFLKELRAIQVRCTRREMGWMGAPQGRSRPMSLLPPTPRRRPKSQ